MLMLFILALMVLDLMIMLVLFLRVIQLIMRANTIKELLLWVLSLLVIVLYLRAFYQATVIDSFESGIMILFYPVIFTILFWLAKKINSFKKR